MVTRNLDATRRVRFWLKEDHQRVLKAILSNQNLDASVRWWAQVKRSRLTRQGNLTRVRNRCIQTNRSRSVIGYYKLSRLRLLKLAHNRGLPGLRKSSW